MGTEFTPIFIFILVAILTAVGMLVTSAVLGPHKQTRVKQMPYESGMNPFGDARQRFDVRYYLVAILFLLFDVELLYLYPWAVAQWSAGSPAIAGLTEPGGALPGADAGVAEAFARPFAAGVGIPAEFRGLVFGEILVFIVVLAAAYAYAWRKGVFTWR